MCASRAFLHHLDVGGLVGWVGYKKVGCASGGFMLLDSFSIFVRLRDRFDLTELVG
jgi:hypothetical protein